MGVSKNRGTPKWMVKIMENPIKIDDLGVPLFLETSIYLKMLNVQDSYLVILVGVFFPGARYRKRRRKRLGAKRGIENDIIVAGSTISTLFWCLP